MVKSVGRKVAALWCFVWQIKKRIKSSTEERRRSREAEGGREGWRKVLKKELEIQRKSSKVNGEIAREERYKM